MDEMEFYRYEASYYGEVFRLKLITLNLHKETPKGYWIGYGNLKPACLRSSSRWVSKTGRKRYAYPTKEEAMTNYIKRTERRVKILRGHLKKAEIGLKTANNTILK